MQLRPDPTTVRIVPWATDPTAQVIHDCFDHQGNLVPYAPRTVLRRVCDLFAAQGLQPIVAPELEFYLTARNTDPNTLLGHRLVEADAPKPRAKPTVSMRSTSLTPCLKKFTTSATRWNSMSTP